MIVFFLTKNARTNEHPHAKKQIQTFHKNQLNIYQKTKYKMKTINFLEDIGENLDNFGFVYDFLYTILKAGHIKE